MVELTYLSKKKLLFLFVFSTYLIVLLIKFRSGELIGCGTWFHIQRVPTLHTFDRPHYPKKKKYLKKHDDDIIITFFRYFFFLGWRGPSKVCSVGTRWMWNQIPHPTSSPDQNLIKSTIRYVENTNKKNSFF